MQLKSALFLLLVVKPLAIVGLSAALSGVPHKGPAPTPQERQELHAQWLKELFEQHHKFTELKLIYARLRPSKKQNYGPSLSHIHQLYQKAVETLTKWEKENGLRWELQSLKLQKLTNQIEQAQAQFKTNLTPHSRQWLYQI